LVFARSALLINHKEGTILGKILHSNAPQIENSPPTVLDIFSSERLLEIRP
jgi:hypothetical protein